MTVGTIVLGLVTSQRLAELVLSRRNAQHLLARGGIEAGAGHYPAMVAVHAAWLAGLWLLALDRPVHPVWLAVYLLLLVARVWVMATLGPRWTTRIIVLPGVPLVHDGPYRFLNHPNYVVVAGEVAVLPLAFGLGWYAIVFSLLNAAILFVRIRAENAALATAPAATAHGPRG
jgi:methyltransferase